MDDTSDPQKADVNFYEIDKDRCPGPFTVQVATSVSSQKPLFVRATKFEREHKQPITPDYLDEFLTELLNGKEWDFVSEARPWTGGTVYTFQQTKSEERTAESLPSIYMHLIVGPRIHYDKDVGIL
mgnify:CR=1 FL=1